MAVDPSYTDKVREAVARETPKLTPAADAARASGLAAALAVEEALAGALALRRARAAAKYGAESDQVAAASQRLTLATTRTTQLRAAVQRAAIAPPDVPAGAAAIFGLVVVGDEKPAGLVVVAVNARNEVSGRSKIGVDGAYKIVLPARAAAAAEDKAEPLAVRLQVARGEQTLLASDETLTLKPGDLVRRDLTLPAG